MSIDYFREVPIEGPFCWRLGLSKASVKKFGDRLTQRQLKAVFCFGAEVLPRVMR